MTTGRVQLAFLADVQIGCMATFSGSDEKDVARFAQRGMRVRPFPHTDSLEWDLDRFRSAVGELNRLQPDLAVIGGDMIDDIGSPEQLEAFREMADLSAVPFQYAPGNHDICPDAAVPTPEALEWYRSNFGPEHSVITADLDEETTLTVIVVNSAVIYQPRNIEGAFESELSWLDTQLQRRRPGPTIVVSHHPPFLRSPDEGASYWNLPPARRLPFLDLVSDAGVDLLLCGHRHLNDSAEYGGVEIVTTSAVGFPLGVDTPGFRLVEVTGSGVSHTYCPLDDPGWDRIGGKPEPMDQ